MADKFMVADALAAGMSPQQISLYVRQNGLVPDTTGVAKWQAKQATGDVPHVPFPSVPRQVTSDSGPGLTQQQTNRDFGRIITHEVGPTAASLALTAMVPEAGLLRIPAALARPAVAYGAGVAGEGAAQAIHGEALDPGAMNERGLREGFGQSVGELLTGWMPKTAHDMYRDALQPSVGATKTSAMTESRLAGKQVIPQEADLTMRGLSERIPLGRATRGGATSAERLDAIKAPPTRQLQSALAEADAAGNTTSIVDIVAQMHALRDQLSREQGGLRASKLVDRWINELLVQHPNPMTATELEAQKRVWQKQAKAMYKGKPAPTVALRARFNATLARAARERLEAIPTPMYSDPTKTLGEQIAAANVRLSGLKPIEEAAADAEAAIVAGTNKGRVFPHFTPKGIEMPRLSPAYASRLAILLNNPALQAGIRRAPNVGMAGMSTADALLNPPQVPFNPAQRDR